MGIEGFTEWFLQTFQRTSTVIHNGAPPIQKDHIMVDMNQLIHLGARKAKDEEHLFIKIFSSLDKLLKLFVPTRSLFLVLDGPASKAKFIEQRKRRRVKKSGTSKKTQVIDKLQFTPGCSFMARLKEALKHFCCARVQSKKYSRVKFYISGADVAGEGEVKIIRYIQALNRQYRDNSYLIVGSDADLILLGLSTRLPFVDIYTSRQIPGQKHKINVLMSVDELWNSFLATFPNCDPGKVSLDFIVLSVMMGNDYVPKFCGLNLGNLWGRYVFLKQKRYKPESFLYNSRDGSVDYDFLFELLKGFKMHASSMKVPPLNYVKHYQRLQALKETGQLPPSVPVAASTPKPRTQASVASADAPIASVAPATTNNAAAATAAPVVTEAADGLLLINPSLPSAGDLNVEISDSNSSPVRIPQIKRYKPVLKRRVPQDPQPSGAQGEDDPEEDYELDPEDQVDSMQQRWRDYDPVDHVAEYIHGILWIMRSYLTGRCTDYDWFFPYSSGPSSKEYGHFMESDVALGLMKAKQVAPKRLAALPPYKFALMILPGKASVYFPEVVRPLVAADHPVLGEIFNGKFRPYIDADLVEQEVDKLIVPADLEPQDAQVMLFDNVIRFEFWQGAADFVAPLPPTKNSRPLFKPYNIISVLFDENLGPLTQIPAPNGRKQHYSPPTQGNHYQPPATLPYQPGFSKGGAVQGQNKKQQPKPQPALANNAPPRQNHPKKAQAAHSQPNFQPVAGQYGPIATQPGVQPGLAAMPLQQGPAINPLTMSQQDWMSQVQVTPELIAWYQALQQQLAQGSAPPPN